MQNQGHSSPDNYIPSGASSNEVSTKSDHSGRQHISHSHPSQRMLDPNPSINELRRLIPTIGMERGVHDISFSKVIHSPADSTSQSTGGFETNSETSVRSPSGLSSLPSIGSPSSVTSPITCTANNYFDANIPMSLLSNGSGNQDWYTPISHAGIELPSAFKPLATASSITSYRVSESPKRFSATSNSTSNNYPFSSVSGSSNIFGSASFNNIMSINSNSSSVISNQISQINRTRVGADPRDAKNPLSISQLTGNTNAIDQLRENENSRKDFMQFSGRVPIHGLTDIGETNTRSNNSRRNSVSDKLHKTFTAERISSLIV